MANSWKKALIWLGLGTDEDYEPQIQQEAYGQNGMTRPPAQQGTGGQPYPSPQPARGPASYRPQPASRADSGPQQQYEPGEGPVRPVPQSPSRGANQPQTRSASVRPIPPTNNTKPRVVSPGAFNDAQEVADTFKGNQPVIVNLQNADRELSRRLIDFSSGLCYGLGGRMEKVADHVYLLTPSDVEVSDEDRRGWEAGPGLA